MLIFIALNIMQMAVLHVAKPWSIKAPAIVSMSIYSVKIGHALRVVQFQSVWSRQ